MYIYTFYLYLYLSAVSAWCFIFKNCREISSKLVLIMQKSSVKNFTKQRKKSFEKLHKSGLNGRKAWLRGDTAEFDSAVILQSLTPRWYCKVWLRSDTAEFDSAVILQSLTPWWHRRVWLRSDTAEFDSVVILQSLTPWWLGCPLISLGSETKRKESENERSEIARKKG